MDAESQFTRVIMALVFFVFAIVVDVVLLTFFNNYLTYWFTDVFMQGIIGIIVWIFMLVFTFGIPYGIVSGKVLPEEEE